METAAEDPVEFANRENCMLHMFAMYLLAQFRETRAYRPIVRMFSAPGETSYDLAGETSAEGLSNILGSIYDGDPAPLQSLIENPGNDEYVRSSGIETFRVLLESGQLTREEVLSYYRRLFQEKLERSDCYAWMALTSAVADLRAPELMDEVRRAYADGLIGRLDFEGIEKEVMTTPREQHDQFRIVTDAIAEMEWWAAFDDEEDQPATPLSEPAPQFLEEPAPPPATSRSYAFPPPIPVRSTKVGRNNPCPCGSGKKYKKCCGK